VFSLLGALDSDDELSRVFMVRGFVDVFVPIVGLPPKRAIEFQIDLVSRAELVSRPPSRMTPSEMRELKVQLVGLEGKSFVKPSSLP
jgi:hypothetical protein